MSADSAAAAADLADALDEFADKAVGPDPTLDQVWVTVGTAHDIEQRTVLLPVSVADWIAELVREETQTLDAGTTRADPYGDW
ncbi:hypothetical protein ACFYNO_33215 [Kitasatospora sp. NPDC006697]|uniref:hypothetical protein n=1 Tax=Kitasatospora sp. NPDC006697 TaxID=3364020 RepID=UPI0036AEFF69